MRILIVRNNSNPKACEAAILLGAYLQQQGIEFTSLDSFELPVAPSDGLMVDRSWVRQFDGAVVLGGDGTILRAAHQIAYENVPILGVNYGNLGFMANSSSEGVVASLAACMSDEATRESRTNLRIDVFCEDDPAVEDAIPGTSMRQYFALNEMAITRGDRGRIIGFDYMIAGERMCSMRGDGLVVATATGSTAYALSAGGPLVSPGFGGLVVVPIAPHTLHSRAVVTEPADVVEVLLDTDSEANQEATLFIDGELIERKTPIRRIVVSRGDCPTVLLRYRSEGFYTHAAKTFFD